MSTFQRIQQAVEATPTSISWSIMIGGVVAYVLQPLAIIVTATWGILQIHGWVEKKWGRDFLWLNRIFRKVK